MTKTVFEINNLWNEGAAVDVVDAQGTGIS